MVIQNHQKFVILKNSSFKILWLIGFLLGATIASGQRNAASEKKTKEVDFQLWGGKKISAKFNKSWGMNLFGQGRVKSEMTEFDRILGELEVCYNPRFHRIVKPIKIGLGARYIGNFDNKGEQKGFENFLRVHVDFVYKLKIKRFYTAYRLRYQAKINLIEKSPIFKNKWIQDLRNLLKIGYNFKKWKLDPEIWFELFFHNELGELDGFTKCRVGIKTDYDFDNSHSIGIKYFAEIGTNYYNSKIVHVIALFYQYKLKFKKCKKK